MPEFTHLFNAGKMNKDLDERLVPQGQYRDALNLDLANSENGNSGALQNVQGNTQLRKSDENLTWTSGYIDQLQNAECIGVYRNDINEKIYWFIAAPNHGAGEFGISAIAEYDQTSNTIQPIVVDTKGILKFNPTYLITGINVIDKFLFWTDNQTEPKKINIEKFKTGSVDFVTHTKIPGYIPGALTGQPQYSVNLTGAPDFIEEDVTVIKMSPLAAPVIDSSSSKFGDNVPGTGISPLATQVTNTTGIGGMINFTYVRDTDIAPDEREPLPTYGEYLVAIEADPNAYADSSIPGWNGEVTFIVNTPPVDEQGNSVWQQGDLVTLTSDFTTQFFINYDWQVSIEIVFVNNTTVTGRIQAISRDIEAFEDENGDLQVYNWECLLNEDAPMFEYVFPRFAYRWKYIDNEYSTFSPFSSVVFEGGEFEYLSSDGYNQGMTNNIRKLIIGNLSWGSQEVQEVEILFKESNSTAVYTVDTLKREDFATLPSTFEVETELIGAIVQSNQILRPWDNVPRAALAQEVIGNRIVYGNYLQNYNVSGAKLNLTSVPHNHEGVSEPTKIGFPNPSIKSIRTYQAGAVFIDKYGRETPVFTSKRGSTKVDISDSDKANKLSITTTGTPPDFATHYKFFIKENSNEYYNLALDKFYNAEDGNVWLSFPSSERNKVDIETYLILKKQHDTNTPVKSLNRYKILDIKAEAPKFISTFDDIVSSTQVTIIDPVDVGYLLITFKGPNPTINPQFGPKLNGGKIEFVLGGASSAKYDVKSARTGNPNGNDLDYTVILKSPLGPDASFMANLVATQAFSIQIFEENVKTKPEFEGRFFVKINRDFSFDTNIIASFAAMDAQYAIKDEWIPTAAIAYNDPAIPRGYYYADNGNDSDSCWWGADDRYRLYQKGWDAGVGEWVVNTPDSAIQEKYPQWQPPTRNSNRFGILTARSAGPNEYIDPVMGHVMSQFIGGNSTGTGAFANGYLSVGAIIRFIHKNGVDQSKEYTVRYTLGQWARRGGTVTKGTKCAHEGDSRNFRYSIYIELEEDIIEDWMPLKNDWNQLNQCLPSIQVLERVINNDNKLISSTNPAIFETEPKEKVDLDLYYEASDSLPISNYSTPNQELSWFNCYSYGQGVESNRVRDDFNAVTIDKGVKVSTVLDEPYASERRASGFIFSQIFNSTSGINRLNQFIQAEPITKDLNPIHGSIQKLHARDTDLITLCEDKCFRVLANKDALFNADGNTNLTGNTAVLGQTVPYAGNFGISTNPESFASFGFRSYFADKNRGAVIRLSRDGITVISEQGMNDFFSDNLASSTKIIGSYDEDKSLYNITLNGLSPDWQKQLSPDQDYNLTAECENPITPDTLVQQTTVSFDEQVTGWTSRKSFIPEQGISLNNTYYTFKNALIWEHGLNNTYNNFYSNQYFSTLNLLINDSPQAVKGFTALNYSGTQSRELEYQYNNTWYSIAEVNANQVIPTAVQVKKEGWYTNYIRTNLESGEVKEFENKEGKYFNYIKALEVCKSGVGIGNPDGIDPEPLDFIVTTTISTSCSGSGSPTPDTNFEGWYQWNAKGKTSSIINETTAQSAKCIIDDFYDYVSGNYGMVTINYNQFKYVFSDGISVGTQMYDKDTLQPITEAGAYLYITPPPIGIAPDGPSLDPNNPASVPNTYFIVIWGSDGIIDSVTPYNTLATCASSCLPNQGPARMFAGYTNNVQNTNWNTSNTDAEIICILKAAMDAWHQSPLLVCGPGQPLYPNCKSRGWKSGNIYWYNSACGGATELEVGVTAYKYNTGSDTYVPWGNKVFFWNRDTGALAPYSDTFWSDIQALPDAWAIVRTDSNSVVTSITQLNTISQPNCV